MLALLLAASFGADVPVGEVAKYTFASSKIFLGTTRDYWVYIPKQYDGKTPACVHVNQDGIQFGAVKDGKTAGVFDTLIAARKMPVTIGVFIRPGVVKAVLPNALDRFNRSYEYDGLGDNYAKFLLDELLPEVEKKTASDGRKIIFSKDGNDRSIGGSSSGAIAAFTAAWERPDAFRRVFSSIGTYVGLRGGNEYPTLIRKVEPKPLRIYLEDGSNDQNIYGGDWWMANQSMERSLKFMGYDVEHKWGDGGHNNKHATEIFPEAMAWLWRDYPKPIVAGAGSPDFKEILVPGEGWNVVGSDYQSLRGIASNKDGAIYFCATVKNKSSPVINQIDKANVSKWTELNRPLHVQGVTLGGSILGTEEQGTIASISPTKNEDRLSSPLRFSSVVHLHNTNRYAISSMSIEPNGNTTDAGICLINAKNEVTRVESFISSFQCMAVSPDQSLIYAARDRWVWSYQIQPDGTLSNGQRYCHLHVDDEQRCRARAMNSDRDGRLWVATDMGLQVCDQAGRVHCILASPDMPIGSFCFGGPEFDTLYCTCGDKVYSRRVKVKGAMPFLPPIKPPPPKL